MAFSTRRSTALRAFGLLLSPLCLVCGAEDLLANDNERWPAPFGDPAGCACTSYCSGRVFMSVTKAF